MYSMGLEPPISPSNQLSRVPFHSCLKPNNNEPLWLGWSVLVDVPGREKRQRTGEGKKWGERAVGVIGQCAYPPNSFGKNINEKLE
jgi:hypothetical protein